MAASSAESGTGTLLSWNSVNVAEVNSVGEQGVTTEDIEVTHHSSDDQFKEFIPGLHDGGTIPFECNFDGTDAGQAAIIADAYTGVKYTTVVTLPNTEASTWTFTAHLNDVKLNPKFNDKIILTGNFRVSGKPVFAL